MQDYDTCLDLIEKTLEGPKTGQMYHAMFTKAMILRLRGKVQDSLATLEDAIRLDPQNPRNLKEVAHSLHLLGKHSVALDVYDEAIKKSPRDWELFHNKGLCYVHLKHFIECARPLHTCGLDSLRPVRPLLMECGSAAERDASSRRPSPRSRTR